MKLPQFVLLPVLLCIGLTQAAPVEDLIVDLPGLVFDTNYAQYSGYLQATEGRFLHYWFVESQSDPINDPVLLWLNGGPGCSSLLGFFTELGPFYVDQDGEGILRENPYSWNKFANVIFLESPACVGFSYDVDGNCRNGDSSTAEQNYLALQDFFNKFPEYAANEFYISGESYAGIYIPTLMEKIIDGEYPFNFRGFAIGNGYFDISLNDNSLIFFAYYHSVIGDELWANLIDNCCRGDVANRASCEFSVDTSADCTRYVDEVIFRVDYDGLNPYNLLATCGADETSVPNSRYNVDMRTIFRRNENRPVAQEALTGDYDPACSSYNIEASYLNDPATKAAIHIAEEANDWSGCSNLVSLQFSKEYNYTVDLIQYAAKTTGKGLIYNGDVDMVCNYLGNLWDIEDLRLPVLNETRKWVSDGQVAGYLKSFENLTFLTVKGAGHMVPSYKPKAALKMLQSFLTGTPY